MASTINMQDISHVIMDIEGTVASISMVHEKMFPFVRTNVDDYLKTTWADEVTQADIKLLIEQSDADKAQGVDNIKLITLPIDTPDVDALRAELVANVLSQMDIDRKIGALKTLQGHIWKKGFQSGELVGELYDDVYAALNAWVAAGKVIAIYSSGSVGAQVLLFSNTQRGDLTPMFNNNFFDTAVGHKREAQSYTNIATKLNVDPAKCLFLTDICEEGVAAVEAGMKTLIVIRPGNNPLNNVTNLTTIDDFVGLF